MSTDQPRPEVVNAGAAVLHAAVAYVDARNDGVSTLELVLPYQRLERAVEAFHEATGE